MKTTSKKRLKILGYNLGVIILLFSLIELGFTYYLNNPASAPSWLLPSLKTYADVDRTMIQFDPECSHYSDDLFYELNSGEFTFSNREFSNPFLVNSQNFRDDERSLDNPKIVVLGDSYAMGWGVDQNETFAQIVEKELGLLTLNTGVSSYGTARELHSLRKVKLDSVQYILLQYCSNDYKENKQYYLTNDSLAVSGNEDWNKEVQDQAARTAYYPFKHLLHLIPLVYHGGRMPLPKAQRCRGSATVQSISAEKAFLNALKTSKHLPKDVQIIVFSIEPFGCNNFFITDIKKQLDKELNSSLNDQLSFIDLTGLITDKKRFILDPHLTSEGHRAVADAIVQHIDEMKLKSKQEKWYYDSGALGYVCDYKNGLKHGNFVCYWENGKVSREAHYKNGLRQGEEINYTATGWMFERKYFDKDVLKGPHLTYDSLGTLIDSIYH